MRLVLDGRIMIPRTTGAGRYVFELARRLPGLASDLKFDALLLPSMRATTVPAMLADAGVTVHFVGALVRSARQWLMVPRILERLRPDLYHYPFVNLPLVRFPSVVTIYDLNMVLDADYFERIRGVKRFLARRLIASSLRRSRAAIAISHATQAALRAHYPAHAEKVRMIHLGVDATAWAAHGNGQLADPLEPWRSRPYVLYVGVERPHKNLVRLVRAFARFRADGRWRPGVGPYLRLAGVGPGSTELRGQVAALNLAHDVRMDGEVDDVALGRIYGGAALLAYVSSSEGFGVPILEAFGAGTPVVAAQVSSLMEVGGDAAVYAHPDDELGIAAALTRVWSDEALRRTLIERGRRRADIFSWDAMARATLAVYREVLRSPTPHFPPAKAVGDRPRRSARPSAAT